MRIVVTGSSGHLGRVVVRELMSHGHEVVPVDRAPPREGPTRSDVPPTRVIDLAGVDGSPSLLDEAVAGADAVCHLGNIPAFSGDSDRAPAAFANNLGSTYNVFRAASRAGVRTMVYASSVQAYGCLAYGGDPRGASPPRYFPVDEDHPLLPRDGYPLSKAMGEEVLLSFVRRAPEVCAFSLRFSWLTAPHPPRPDAAERDPSRPPTAPDPAWKPHVAGSLFTYVHVFDAARATRLCCESGRRGHTPLNIVAPRAMVPWDPDWLREAYGVEPTFRTPLEQTDALFASTRAADAIGFRAERSIHAIE